MFTRRAFFLLAALSIAGGLGTSLGISQDTRSVSGIVTDSRGNALPGAAVQIENTRTLEIASYLTQNDGKYYFHQLSPDIDFTLKAKYKRWWSKEKLLNKLDSKKQVTIDLTIPIE